MKTIKTKQIVRLWIFVTVAFGIAMLTGCENKPPSNASPSASTQPTQPIQRSKSGSSGSLTLNPNPIQVCDGSGLGVTNISWTFSGATMADVRVGSPNGMLLVQAGGPGTKATGKWVGTGSTFYLQDISNGLPLTADNTIAKVTANVTAQGCP